MVFKTPNFRHGEASDVCSQTQSTLGILFAPFPLLLLQVNTVDT
ncbi:Uncharacterised protein [Burkholderia pseudomallei]|nr:hypothetical protein X995_630 [Burkholderia pseudomallei B03]AIV97239.1 hypothetical protein X996_583 [Burkholderia pseudomallei A79A]CAJ2921106.1 Uncharacterised protein [Burkholderia pseudomallei]CAJ2978445.1 Uncharacterised protein [Burkholderia pseudomallei]CAJ3373670.1 Uncharacterised protein [Burkholderia pseudomallei]